MQLVDLACKAIVTFFLSLIILFQFACIFYSFMEYHKKKTPKINIILLLAVVLFNDAIWYYIDINIISLVTITGEWDRYCFSLIVYISKIMVPFLGSIIATTERGN